MLRCLLSLSPRSFHSVWACSLQADLSDSVPKKARTREANTSNTVEMHPSLCWSNLLRIFCKLTVIRMKHYKVETLVNQTWEGVVWFSQGDVNRCLFIPNGAPAKYLSEPESLLGLLRGVWVRGYLQKHGWLKGSIVTKKPPLPGWQLTKPVCLGLSVYFAGTWISLEESFLPSNDFCLSNLGRGLVDLVIFRSFLRLLCVSFPSLEGMFKELSTQQMVHGYKNLTVGAVS